MDSDDMTIKEACEFLNMARPNVQKLIRQRKIISLGFKQVVGDSWRHMVSRASVEVFSKRKLDYGDDRAVFRVDLDLSVYEKIARGDVLLLNDEERTSLVLSFQKAVNITIRMAEYHAQRRQRQQTETTDLSLDEIPTANVIDSDSDDEDEE
jgi:hypothetical protein